MNIENPQQLVHDLIEQHNALRADFSTIAGLLSLEKEENSERISEELLKFKETLLKHLKLENGTFYTDFLNKKVKKGEDIEKLQEFIKQMSVIGKVVMLFLDTYLISDNVRDNHAEFKKRFDEIRETLNVRLEVEENEAYTGYLSM